MGHRETKRYAPRIFSLNPRRRHVRTGRPSSRKLGGDPTFVVGMQPYGMQGPRVSAWSECQHRRFALPYPCPACSSNAPRRPTAAKPSRLSRPVGGGVSEACRRRVGAVAYLRRQPPHRRGLLRAVQPIPAVPHRDLEQRPPALLQRTVRTQPKR